MAEKRTYKRDSIGDAEIRAAVRWAPSLTAAARDLGVDRSTLHRWLKSMRQPTDQPKQRRRHGQKKLWWERSPELRAERDVLSTRRPSIDLDDPRCVLLLESSRHSVLMVPDDGNYLWPTLGPQLCRWIETNLVFGRGDLLGEPAVLDDEKRALIYRIYEVYPADHELAGRRRFKRAGLSLAKGLAKTELAAWIAAAEVHPEAPVRCVDWKNGEPVGGPVTDPYIPLIAYTEEQSDELCYGALKSILEQSTVAADLDIGIERIQRVNGDGKVVSLAGSPNARDGARTTFMVEDETHWWTSDKLKRAHQTMLANLPKRKAADAWSLEVTTAPEPGGDSVAEATMEYGKALKDGRAQNPRMFYFHRQASDEHDLDTEAGAKAAVIEASGPAASWRDIDSIVELWRDPTTDRRYWERVWCNRLVQSSRQAFNIERWRGLKAESPVKPGDLITIGFDGAMTYDSTGVTCTHVETGYQWRAGLWERPYEATDWQVPTAEVDDLITALFEQYTVWSMYADPPYWQAWIAKWQGEHGEKTVIEWWTNRRRPMAHALESYQTAITEGTVSHSGDKHLERHLGNACRHELPQRNEDDGSPLWLIRKERSDSPYKIDLAMAAVLSWEARNDAIAGGAVGSGVSVYETRGIVNL